VGQASTNTFQSSFYIQPGSLHFNRANEYGSHPRKPEQTAGTFELSLRSTRGDSVPAISNASHIIIAQTEVKITDYDISNNHVSTHVIRDSRALQSPSSCMSIITYMVLLHSSNQTVEALKYNGFPTMVSLIPTTCHAARYENVLEF
jgi:hypothetical protein